MLLANTDWDEWTQEKQESFGKGMAEEMTQARTQYDVEAALTREKKLAIIGQALLDLEKINAKIRETKAEASYMEPQYIAEIIEELEAKRVEIYNAVISKCGDVLQADKKLAQALEDVAYATF